ncbi:MAG: right-handed parallel beta-helix repeat-containing protein [Planctomycetota bacterium]
MPKILILPATVSRSLLTIMPVLRPGHPGSGRPSQGDAMCKEATPSRSKSRALRLRAIRERIANWRLQARRAATLGLVTAGFALAPTGAWAQLGQTAMAPAGGVVNRAVAGFQGLNQNGPGWLYYGLNAADRGLGYVGSYMTLGGFVPVAEDDLGGFWAADLRGHLSEYGGFFSNLGAVRKQFIGGTLLGVGVYWDYDGDLNQYADTTIANFGNPIVIPGGQVYNQVGISGEWLTDYGNLRSNGYIPVGNTAQLTGPFVGNSLLCVNGINAALGGADLEVGAYIPGLADWAGMISVGGYALGNTRYQFVNGASAVPWFGGVYTRLDMTFVENWDFSLQANNDSYFDWTGFARLTYRMGGSRRRNVPDQVEQPMMRNEHIARAYQAPVAAINPDTGTPWRVFHVDNASASPGNGSAESPFTTLGQAESAATAAFDIVYVRVGNSATTPYLTPATGYTFANTNQYLIGEGSTFQLPTLNCGPEPLFAGNGGGQYPIITNPVGPAIIVDQDGTVVSHLQIAASPIGISDGPGLVAPGQATVSDIVIRGPAGIPQRGVEIANSTGRFNFDRIRFEGLANDGFVISAANAEIAISNSQLSGVGSTGLLVSGSAAKVTVNNTTFRGTIGTAVDAAGANTEVTLVNTTVEGNVGDAIEASGNGSRVTTVGTQIIDTQGSALVASGTSAAIRATNTQITRTASEAVRVSGNAADVVFSRSSIDQAGSFGGLLTGTRAGLYLTDGTTIRNSGTDGLRILGDTATVLVQDSSILNSGANGVYVNGSVLPFSSARDSQVTVLRSVINGAAGAGVLAENVNFIDPTDPAVGGVVQIFDSRIQNTVGGGVVANDSNVDIGRDPANPASRGTTIQNAGAFGLAMTDDSRVRIRNSTISGVGTGISVTGTPVSGERSNLIATNNVISATGIGIFVTANHDAAADPPPPTFTNVNLEANRITSGPTSPDILLETTDVPDPFTRQPIGVANTSNAAQLGAFNFGATVEEDPGTPGLTAYLLRFLPDPVGPITTVPPPSPSVPIPPR